MMFESDKKKICVMLQGNKRLVKGIKEEDTIHFYDKLGYVFVDSGGYVMTETGESGYLDED